MAKGEIKHKVDLQFIKSPKIEGFRSRPYVPLCLKESVNKSGHVCYGKPIGSVIGKSGVTIGGGIDLGQFDEDELKRWGVPKNIIKKVKIFLVDKKTGSKDPKEVLKKHSELPPKERLTPNDISIINKKHQEYSIPAIARRYNKITNKNFYKLDTKSQTVIYSLLHHFGPNTNIKWIINIIKHISEGRIEEATSILKEQKDYSDRRKFESEYLKQDNSIIMEKSKILP